MQIYLHCREMETDNIFGILFGIELCGFRNKRIRIFQGRQQIHDAALLEAGVKRLRQPLATEDPTKGAMLGLGLEYSNIPSAI